MAADATRSSTWNHEGSRWTGAFAVELNTAVLETTQSSPAMQHPHHLARAWRRADGLHRGGTGELIDRYQLNVEEIRNIELGLPTITSRLLVFIGARSRSAYLFDGADRQPGGSAASSTRSPAGSQRRGHGDERARRGDRARVRRLTASRRPSANGRRGPYDVVAVRGDATPRSTPVVDASRVARTRWTADGRAERHGLA
jgi:hypothetical protein